MANEQNLKRAPLSTEEARRLGSLGGKASVASRRKKKALQELAKEILSMPLKSGDIEGLEQIAGFAEASGKNLTVAEAMLMAQANKALKGDATAFAIMRDTAGERPVEKIEVGAGIADAEKEIAALISKKREDART